MLILNLLANTDPAIPTQPGLRPGLTEDQVTPGLLGFVVTFGIVVIMIFLIRDMSKRVRRVRYRAQVEDERVGGPATEHMGIPILKDDAGTPVPARTPGGVPGQERQGQGLDRHDGSGAAPADK